MSQTENYEFHWCPRCETKNRVWVNDPDFTGFVRCWSCQKTFSVERTGGIERLRDSILDAHGLMDGEKGEGLAKPVDSVKEDHA